jgi:hypothetical protein
MPNGERVFTSKLTFVHKSPFSEQNMSTPTACTEPAQDVFKGKRYSFTPAAARAAALKRAENERLKLQLADQIIAQANQSTPIPSPDSQTACTSDAQPADAYTCTSLPRVRSHLDRLSALLAIEMDPARLDRLAAAFGKLSEVERQLAGRPLPGSLRPTGKAQNAGMIEQPATAAPVSSTPPAVQDDGQE